MVLGGCGPPSYRGRAFFWACQLARGGFFRHHFAFPDRWNIDLRQTSDYCNISSHFDNSLFRLPGGLHSKCSERCQTNYGSDFLFRILQFWFQNLLALVTRYLESTFCPRFACIPGSLKCERGARAPGRPRHNMDHISTPQHALFSPPPPSSRLINRIKRDLSSLAAGRHSLGTIVGWIEVTREAEEAEEVTRGLELVDEQLVIVGKRLQMRCQLQEGWTSTTTYNQVQFWDDLTKCRLFTYLDWC